MWEMKHCVAKFMAVSSYEFLGHPDSNGAIATDRPICSPLVVCVFRLRTMAFILLTNRAVY